MPDTQTVNKEASNKEVYHPSDAEAKMQAFHRDRIKKAVEILNQPREEFDGMTLLQTYRTNRRVVNSYLRPKLNDDEVRVVGGTTEKRIESVVNELSSMNYQPEIRVFDKNDLEILDLGEAAEDLVTRTNQIENDEDMRSELAWELVSQPAVFVEELYETMDNGVMKQKRCKKRLRTCIEAFVGDPTLSAYKIQEQPYIILYDRMTHPVAERYFKNNKNWNYVKAGQNLEVDVYNDSTFRLGFLADNEVEVVKYYSVPDNEYQVYVNGVPMFEKAQKLPWRYRKYPITVGVAKPIHRHFMYGRSYAQMMKFLQSFSDETVRNIIRKFRQAIEPPRAVLSASSVYSRDIFNAGSIAYGVDADALKKLVEHDGVTAGEMSVLEMVKGMQEEFSARSSTNVGVAGDRKETATAIIQQQQESIKMLGQAVIGFTRLIREYTDLRLCNIFENLTKPTGSYIGENDRLIETFKAFTLKNTSLGNGKTGDKIIQFAERNLTPEETQQLSDYEEAEEQAGSPKKITVINAKLLRNLPMLWHVTVKSKPIETDDLDRLMFTDKLNQAGMVAQMIQKPLNPDQVIREFEETWRVKKWFEEVPAQGGMEAMMAEMAAKAGGGAEAPAQGGQSELGAQMEQGVTGGLAKPEMPNPTLNKAVGVPV